MTICKQGYVWQHQALPQNLTHDIKSSRASSETAQTSFLVKWVGKRASPSSMHVTNPSTTSTTAAAHHLDNILLVSTVGLVPISVMLFVPIPGPILKIFLQNLNDAPCEVPCFIALGQGYNLVNLSQRLGDVLDP